MNKRAWRVCENKKCNDWNDEPKYHIVPYQVIGESKGGKAYLVERAGWHGKRHQHYLPKGELFFDAQEAQAELQKKYEEDMYRWMSKEQ